MLFAALEHVRNSFNILEKERAKARESQLREAIRRNPDLLKQPTPETIQEAAKKLFGGKFL